MMVFTPIASAMFDMVHALALPVALPETATVDDPVDQVTEMAPDPPEATPESVTEADVVVAAVGLTVNANDDDVEAVPGAGEVVTALFCAAYRV